MPPHDGEDMAPTKRIDETADMTALSPQIYEYPTVQIRSGSRMVQRTPAAPESSSRDSPGVERTPSKAQRFQIWVMRGNPILTGTKTNRLKPTTTKLC